MQEFLIVAVGAIIGAFSAWGSKWIGNKPANKDSDTKRYDSIIDQYSGVIEMLESQIKKYEGQIEKHQERNQNLVERNTQLLKELKEIRSMLCECERRAKELRGGE